MSVVTARKSLPRWSLSYGDITKARKRLGIDHYITFHPTQPSDWWCGWVSPPIHTVWLNPTIPRYDISHTIWHELTHIWQCERDFNGDYATFHQAFSIDYNRLFTELVDNWDELSDSASKAYRDWSDRYYTIPLEAEADTIAKRYAHRYPLIRA